MAFTSLLLLEAHWQRRTPTCHLAHPPPQAAAAEAVAEYEAEEQGREIWRELNRQVAAASTAGMGAEQQPEGQGREGRHEPPAHGGEQGAAAHMPLRESLAHLAPADHSQRASLQHDSLSAEPGMQLGVHRRPSLDPPAADGPNEGATATRGEEPLLPARCCCS